MDTNGLRALLAATALVLAACGGGSGPPPGPAAGFSISVAGTGVQALQGSAGVLNVRVERTGGFAPAIELTLHAPPAGVTAAVTQTDADIARLPLQIGPEVATGTVTLTLRASAGGATQDLGVDVEVLAAQPSSQRLIAAALAGARIDLGTSLLYRLYAMFGSAQLPIEFVGSGASDEDLDLFVEIEAQRASLAPALLTRMQPFLARPDDPASVWSQAASTGRHASGQRRAAAVAERCAGGVGEWITRKSASQPVRAWARCDGNAAGDAAAERYLTRVIAVVDKAWPKMVALMGPAVPDLWGDPAIDVYVVPPGADAPRQYGAFELEGTRGVAIGQPPYAGNTSSAYVMLPTWRMDLADHQLTVIHELFHVLQRAHQANLTQLWFTEASATWASLHFNRTAPIRPADNTALHIERFGGFQLAMESLTKLADTHPYYAYVWPQFMEQKLGAASIGTAWRRMNGVASNAGATDVLDGLLPFAANLRIFALRNLNVPYLPGDPLPRAQRYVGLDPNFPDDTLNPRNKRIRTLTVGPRASMGGLPRPLKPLMAGYFEAEVDNPQIQKVTFDLRALAGLSVDALVQIDGRWEPVPRPLDATNELVFCRDVPAQKLSSIAFIVANHAKTGAARIPEIQVEASTVPCSPVWTGDITRRHVRSDAVLGNYDATLEAHVTFEADPGDPGAYRLRAGTGSYRHDALYDFPGRNPPCRTTERAVGDMLAGPLHPLRFGSTAASLVLIDVPAQPTNYLGDGVTAAEVTQTSNCNDNHVDETAKLPQSLAWWSMGGVLLPLSTDGRTMRGSHTQIDGLGGTITYQWTLLRQNR